MEESPAEPKTTLGNILTQLMAECDLDDAKLARQTGIPASTISRIKLHPDANPTAATLRPIAKFFNISIGQLLGDETFPKDRIPGRHNPIQFTTAKIPVIEWDWVIEWSKKMIAYFQKNLTQWISTEKEVGSNSFALIVPTDSFGIMFRKGVMLIADPEKPARDGDFVLIKIKNEPNILLRQILLDGNEIYIKSVNPEIKGTKLLESKPEFLIVIIETRFSHQESEQLVAKSTLVDNSSLLPFVVKSAPSIA